MLAEDTAGNGGVRIAGTCSSSASGETYVDLGVAAGRVGQEGLPGGVVEARVQGTVEVDQIALWVVVELNPESVELHGLKEVHHVLVVVEGTLGRGSDDIGSSGGGDQLPQGRDHPCVAFITGYS